MTKKVTKGDFSIFVGLIDDYSPIHLDKKFGEASPFKQNIAHGFISGALFSTLVGNKLPSAGGLYVSQSLNFKAPVFAGDIITATVEVIAKGEKGNIVMESTALNQNGVIVVEGETVAKAARQKHDISKY